MTEEIQTTRREACALCRRAFAADDMICLEGKWVCADCKPTFIQMLREGASTADLTVARDRRALVMGRNAVLPDRCVKCNAPANGQRLTRTLYWHSPFVYLLVVVNVLLYAVIAMIVRKRVRIEVGLCRRHAVRRRVGIAVTWFCVLAAMGLFSAGIDSRIGGPLFLLALAALLGAIVCAAVTIPVISARRIDDEYVWLGGVCKAYRDALPEWRGK
ncbi:MAG: hypothetical protein JXR37_19840 [Kiritimatiellae bacterium]|nr:hypothetical protein [Kiritimatiellia bacterium]